MEKLFRMTDDRSLKGEVRKKTLEAIHEASFPRTLPMNKQLAFHLEKISNAAVMMLGSYCASLSSEPKTLQAILSNDAFTILEIHTHQVYKIAKNKPSTKNLKEIKDLLITFHHLIELLGQGKAEDTPLLQTLDLIYFSALVMHNRIKGVPVWHRINLTILEHPAHGDLEERMLCPILNHAINPKVILRKLQIGIKRLELD